MNNFPIRPDIQTEEVKALLPELKANEFEAEMVTLLHQSLIETPWQDELTDSKALERLPGLGHMPLTCKTDQCPFAETCPIMKGIRQMDDDEEADKAREEIQGTDCRVDKVESVRIFAGLVKELKVDPNDTIDLLTLTSLVRLYIMRRRLDWQVAISGMEILQVGGIAQREGQVYYNKSVNGLLKEIATVQAQINSLISQLSASRQDKLKAYNKETNAASQISEALGVHKKTKKPRIIDIEETE